MNRGTVMALEKKTVVLLTPDGQFVRAKRQAQYEIGEEVGDYVVDRATPRIRQRLLQSGVGIAVLLLVMFGFMMFRTPPVVAYVSMDINPSLELGLDAKERVRELRAVNEDAEAIVSGVKYKGRDLETVMSELAVKLVEQHYLATDDREVVIASVPVKSLEKQWEQEVADKMTKILNEAAEGASSAGLVVTTVTLPEKIRDEAATNGISSGKMAFWIASRHEGHDVSLDEIKKESLKDIAESWGGVQKVMQKYEHKSDGKHGKGKEGKKDKDERKEDDKAGQSSQGASVKPNDEVKPNKDPKSEDDRKTENANKSNNDGKINKGDKSDKDDKSDKNDNGKQDSVDGKKKDDEHRLKNDDKKREFDKSDHENRDQDDSKDMEKQRKGKEDNR